MDDLGLKIVSGTWPPGYIIDVDALERELGVSRTVVREAVKILTSKGLIAARPKFGTYVRDRPQWNLLDADVMSWRDTERPDPDLIRDLNEMRRILEPAAARLAADRRNPEEIATMEAALAGMTSDDVDLHVESDLLFHRSLLAATHNELLSRLEVVLKMALSIRDRLAFSSQHSSAFMALHTAVAAAIRDGDPDAAESAMRELLDAAEKDSAGLLKSAATAAAKAARNPKARTKTAGTAADRSSPGPTISTRASRS